MPPTNEIPSNGTGTGTGIEDEVHPMIAVPEAIQIVLVESFRQLLVRAIDGTDSEEVFLYNRGNGNNGHDDAWQQLQGRMLLEDVRMRAPGYPPYAASIMDGYAVNVDDIPPNDGMDTDDDIAGKSPWTHVVKAKVYAGDLTDGCTDTSMAQNNKRGIDVATTDTEHEINQEDEDDDDIQSATSSQLDFEQNDISNQHQEREINDLLPAYYVTTGAVVPNGCNAVIPVEHVTIHQTTNHPDNDEIVASNTSITLLRIPPSAIYALPKNRWIRQPGSDIASDALLLPKNTILDPTAIGLLYQSGVVSVQVRRKINIGIMSTGSELFTPHSGGDCANQSYRQNSSVDWWTYLHENRPGTIPDINRPMLLSMFTSSVNDAYRYNLNVIDLGIVRDDESIVDATKQFEASIKKCDIIISTGGISLGETDFIEKLLMNHVGKASNLHFGRLHMKPGKPTSFFTMSKGRKDDDKRCCLWFALPGNPVSNFVCTQLLVFPALHLFINGIPENCPVQESAFKDSEYTYAYIRDKVVPYLYVHDELHDVALLHDIRLDPERPEYHRITFADENMTSVRSTGIQQSSRLLSLQKADGVVVLPRGTSDHPVAKAGEKYTLLLLFNRNTTMAKQVQESKHILHNADTSCRLFESPLTNDACISEPEHQPQQSEITKHPQLNVSIVQVSPIHVINTSLILDLDETNSNDIAAGIIKNDAISDDAEHTMQISERVKRALSGSKSGPVRIVSNTSYTGTVDGLYPHLMQRVVTSKPIVDILVVIGTSNRRDQENEFYRSPFHRYMQMAHMLRRRLEKVAISMSLFAKQNAVKQDPIVGALFEVVIGYMYTAKMPERCDDQRDANIDPIENVANTDENATNVHDNGVARPTATPPNGCIVVYVPEECLDMSLSCIRSVVKHALQVAR